MFFSCIGTVKKLKSFYHENYGRDKDQCKDKCHDISKKAKLEIGKVEGGLQQAKMVVHWLRSFQDNEWICKNKTNSCAFLFFLASSFKSYEYTGLKTE